MKLEDITIGMRVREISTGDKGIVTRIEEAGWNNKKYVVYILWETGTEKGSELHLEPEHIEPVVVNSREDTSKWHPHHDIIVAWAKGAEVQFSTDEGSAWLTTKSPAWEPNYLYRVKPKEQPKYSIGQILTEESDDKEQFLIAQVEDSKVCLISLVTGNRWYDPISVKSTRAITQEELNKMSGGLTFTS